MTKKDLWNGLNYIDEDLIEEAAMAEGKKRRFPIPRLAAAGICLVIGLGVWGGLQRNHSQMTDGAAAATEAVMEMEADEEAGMAGAATGEKASDSEAAGAGIAAEETEEETAAAEIDQPAETSAGEEITDPVGVADEAQIGEDYRAAADYEELYHVLSERIKAETAQPEAAAEDAEEIMAGEADGGAGPAEGAEIPRAGETEAAAAGGASDIKGAAGDYSRTNTMIENVDEADIVKTDGSYIYTVTGSEVIITDIRNRMPGKQVICRLPQECSPAYIQEIFVDGDIMAVIAGYTETGDEIPTLQDQMEEELFTNIFDRDMTAACIYDISDPLNPSCRGILKQDGWFKTARKVGDQLYLFTHKNVVLPDLEEEELLSEKYRNTWIPSVNGRPVAADCIYLAENSSYGILVSSASVRDPSQVDDAKFIFSEYGEVYVGQNGMYLYYTDWNAGETGWWNNAIRTKIIQMTYKGGRIRVGSHTSVRGEILDSFAISESKDGLRILTTEYLSDGDANNLYLLDSSLKETGKIEKIARGELIYAARYIGDLAYFVTYRNTDPLFVADLSDPANPEILSELKITGFSEYLHPWGEGRLLGIGYETNPSNGETLGIKLTMFDITDPGTIQVEHTLVLRDVLPGPGITWNYRAILADPGKNLIGFSTWELEKEIADAEYSEREDTWSDAEEDPDWLYETPCYRFFTYDPGKGFDCPITEAVGEEDILGMDSRGLYVGDTCYVVTGKNILVFSMSPSWEKLSE